MLQVRTVSSSLMIGWRSWFCRWLIYVVMKERPN